MGGEWRKVQLQDIVTILGDGLHGTPKYDEEGEYYFINGNNLENGRIVFRDTTKRVAHDQFLKHKKNLNDRTILVSINGTIGNVAYYNGEKVILGKSACYFNLIDEVEKGFVRYVLSGAIFQNYLNQYATGTTIKNVSLKDMREFSFRLPPTNEQKSIAHILGTLDDKIELNRQMNATLEAMAQALFKSWFVDFDPVIDNALAAGNPIPDELQARAEVRAALGDKRKPLPEAIQKQFTSSFAFSEEMGWIPEGWEVGALEDIIVLQRGFDLPKKNRIDGDYPLMVASGQDGTHSEYKVKGPGITTGRSGKLGEVNLVLQDFWPLNTTLWVKEYKRSSPYHALYLLRSLGLEKYNAGSAVPTLNRNHVHNIPLPVPTKTIIESHEAVAKNFYKKMLYNSRQIEAVAHLRDTLLPKLLSGQLRIPDAEKLVVDAV